MQVLTELRTLFFPIELTTLWWWWVLLSLLVLWSLILYGLIILVEYSIILSHKRSKKLEKKSIKQREKITQPRKITKAKSFRAQFFPDQEVDRELSHKEEPSLPEIRSLSNSKSSMTKQIGQKITKLFKKQSKKKNILTEETMVIDQNALLNELDSTTEDHKESVNSELDKQDLKKDIIPKTTDSQEEEEKVWEVRSEKEESLMTSEIAEQIDQKTRAKLEREQLKSELEYLKKRGDRDAYESKLIEWLSKEPEHKEAREYLADFYMMDNQSKKALPLYKQLVDRYNEDHMLLWKMAQTYLSLDDQETAEILLQNALSLQPKNPKYAIDLVKIYYSSQRESEALELMEQIVQRRPENMSYREVLAHMYETAWKYRKLVQAYEEMIIINPTNSRLKRKLLEARTLIETS